MSNLISIIIPAYNAENTIKRCVLSAVHQTYRFIEVIVVDDGSIDRTGEILGDLMTDYISVKTFYQSNSGVSRARNKGIEQAEGEWLLFLDADDELDVTICERLYEKAIQYEADMVFCNLVNIDENNKDYISVFDVKEYEYVGSELKELEKKLISKESDSGKSMVSLSGPYCKLIRRKCIKHGFPLEISLGEDTCFVLKLLHNECRKVVYINEFLYYRHIYQGSLSNGGKDEDIRLAAYTNWIDSFYSDCDEYRMEVNTILAKNLLRIVVMYLLSENMSFKDRVVHIRKYRHETSRSLSFRDLFSVHTKRNVKIILALAQFNCFRILYLLLRLRKIH